MLLRRLGHLTSVDYYIWEVMKATVYEENSHSSH